MPPTAFLPTRRALAAVCLALAAAVLASPRPAAAEDLTAVLARPVSPGAIALLAEHAVQPAAQKRLIEAVKHEDAAVRAVAARVAFVTMSKGVAPALISAVAKEEHVHTGTEQVRALMGLLGAPGDAIVLGAVKRLGAHAAIAMAESLARTRPEDIPRHLPVLVAATAKSELSELGAALASASIQHPTHAKDIVESVLAAKSDDLWKAVLEPLHITGRRVPPAALVAGLTAAEESHRVRMLWYVFTLSGEGAPLPDDVISAAAPRPIAANAAAADLTWEAFARELFARQRGTAATKADWTGLLALPARKERLTTLPYLAYGWLTDAEVGAIDTATGRRGEADKVRSAARREREKEKIDKPPAQSTRTIPVFAKGLLADLMTVSGCHPQKNSAFVSRDMQMQFAAGEMKYKADGRPAGLSIVQASLSPECLAFVRAALTLTIASVDHPVLPELTDLVLVLFMPGFLTCADEEFAPSRPRGAELAFEVPQPVTEPKVQFPEQFRRTGIPKLDVFLRVWVSRGGCVSGVETLRGVLPAFDLEAIEALLTTKMKAGTLGGEPIDSTMTYMVRFSLR
jgi:hypothetical protein